MLCLTAGLLRCEVCRQRSWSQQDTSLWLVWGSLRHLGNQQVRQACHVNSSLWAMPQYWPGQAMTDCKHTS